MIRSLARTVGRPLVIALTVAALSLGGEARAAFSVTLLATGNAPLVITDNVLGAPGDQNGTTNRIDVGPTPFSYGGFTISTSSSADYTPDTGSGVALIGQSVLSIRNDSNSGTLTITATNTGTTSPVGTAVNNIESRLTLVEITGTGTVSSRTLVNAFTSSAATLSAFGSASAFDNTNLPASYSFSNQLTFQLAVGSQVDVQSRSFLTGTSTTGGGGNPVPAPPTLLAAMTALPVLGVFGAIRRRMRAIA